MRYWLMKSEPEDLSIDGLMARPSGRAAWTGVRNYQARNFMRDAMIPGDLAFFYHSGCKEPGIAGICEVASGAYPDATQFDPASPYYDPKSDPASPRWLNVDVRFRLRTPFIGLGRLRVCPELARMRLLARGNRLSITPVTEAEWQFIARNLMELNSEF